MVAADLSDFIAVTGQETYGLAANPDLNADYKPNISSPLIDAGIYIPGANDDYGGSAPDIGAFE